MSNLAVLPPAAFATEPDPRVSSHYGFVSTRNVVEALASEGWLVTSADQASTRARGRQPFAKHCVRLRRDGVNAFHEVGDAIPELVVVNSHNRRSAFEVRTGVFRLVCSNGMVLPIFDGEGFRIVHRATLVGDVLTAAERVAGGFANVAERILRWQRTPIPEQQAQRFAERALQLRWPTGSAPITPADLLRTRRTEDAGANLWLVFNRMQENLLRAGMQGQNAAGRRMKVRPIRSAVRDVAINSSLWAAACEVEHELLAA